MLVLGALFVLIVAPPLARWLRGDTARLVPQLVTVACSGALLWQVWRGVLWARQLTVALAFLGGLVAVVLGLIVSAGSTWGLAVLLVGALFLACGVGLVASPDVAAFLRSRHRVRS